jgi:hypothetical protein
MTKGQDAPVPFYCPRCGSPMHKPAGSPFYWHSTNNHRPCSITNVAEIAKSLPDADVPLELPTGQQKRWQSQA